MKLSQLEQWSSFALLGPGFAGGTLASTRSASPCDPPYLLAGDKPLPYDLASPFTLLTDLREETSKGSPRLVYLPYEAAGSAARSFTPRTCEQVDRLEFDAPAAALSAQFDAQGYQDAVESIRQAIARGDVYQVCYTRPAKLAAVSGAALFAALNARGVARFAAWVRLPDGLEFVSASPELFFKINDMSVCSEPMKGTAPAAARDELLASEKDSCELAMITDLVRNDLTPLCRPRSIRVTAERELVELPYAWQTISRVEGDLLDGAGPIEVLAALHPGGSVTGAPKQAALAMIHNLEPNPRGAYCGALGLCHEDRAVFSLLIRTATKVDEGWIYGVGSGIVYDSIPDVELAELRVKLGALAFIKH